MIQIIFLLSFLLSAPSILQAAPQTKPAVSSSEIDQALNEVLEQREYQWRLPREKKEKAEGLLADFWSGLVRFTNRWIRPVRDFFRTILRWILDRASFSGGDGENRRLTPGGQKPLLILLTALIAAVLIFSYWRWRKKKNQEAGALEAQATIAIPDIREENVTADQLPEEEWYVMSSDLLSRGEFRLALRALFMATLAYLGRVDLIRIARFKSNRDYLLELDRKAHDRTELLNRFRENVSVLERVWYGRYPADSSLVRQFAEKYKELKSQAEHTS